MLSDWENGHRKREEHFFENTKFPKDEKSVDQFMRWQIGDSGEEVSEFVDNSDDMVNSVSELFKKSGPAVNYTLCKWNTRMENSNEKSE